MGNSFLPSVVPRPSADSMVGEELAETLRHINALTGILYTDYKKVDNKHVALSGQLKQTKQIIQAAATILLEVLQKHNGVIERALDADQLGEQLDGCKGHIMRICRALGKVTLAKSKREATGEPRKGAVQGILLSLGSVAVALCVSLSSVIVRLVRWNLKHDMARLEWLAGIQESTDGLMVLAQRLVEALREESATLATALDKLILPKTMDDEAEDNGGKPHLFISGLGRPGDPEALPVQDIGDTPQPTSQGAGDASAAQTGAAEGTPKAPQETPSQIPRPMSPASSASTASRDSNVPTPTSSQASASLHPETQEQHDTSEYTDSFGDIISHDVGPANSPPSPKDDLSDSIRRILSKTRARAPDAEPSPPLSRPIGRVIDMSGVCSTGWKFLAIHRPDDWVQLALVPVDRSRGAILLDPVIQIAADTPMYIDLERGKNGHYALRLFLLLVVDRGGWAVVECRLDFGKGPEPRHWTVHRTELPTETGSGAEIRWFLDKDSSFPGVWGESSAGGYFCLREQMEFDVGRDILPWPSMIPPDHIRIHDGRPGETPGTTIAYTFDLPKALITKWEFGSPDNETETEDWSYEDELSRVLDKGVDWHGHPPDAAPGPCRLIKLGKRVLGALCRTVDGEIYVFRGHPWHQGFRDPELVCAVKPGSYWVFCNTSRVLMYVAPDETLTRMHFAMDKAGEIARGEPSPLFYVDSFETTLNDLSRRSPLHYYLLHRRPRSDSDDSDIDDLSDGNEVSD